MKQWGWVIGVLLFSASCLGQEIPVHTEQQLENMTATTEIETEDDQYLQDVQHYRKHPLNLNTVEEDELKLLRLLSDLQIQRFLSYRKLLGELLSVYELQAIPAWDVATIKKLLPYVKVSTVMPVSEDLRSRFKKGDHQLLLRWSALMERSNAYQQPKAYAGSPMRVFFRYRYNYKNQLQFGVTGDKDAGEAFLQGAQRFGFDFYSLHVFVRKTGRVQALALGDYTVNLGQGLIHWQGLAFKKSAEVTAVKRQLPVLRPYSSAGEFIFHRGAGITFRCGHIETTVFLSHRKISTNLALDTALHSDVITSFQSSGYHRTATELADRNNSSQSAIGGSLQYRLGFLQAGLNFIGHRYSSPIQKRDEPYNRYAIRGRTWYNASMDYSYTYKNLHVFGEAALDKLLNPAFVNGIVLSADPRVDISCVYRAIHPGYQSVNGNAFTESTQPTNETGFFLGISVRPANRWRIDMYGDIYKFPWLRYRVDAPSRGREFLLQLTYTASRNTELFTRVRYDLRQINQPGNTITQHFLVTIPRLNWRSQVSHKLGSSLLWRNRIEILWYDHKNRPGIAQDRGAATESGFLFFTDMVYKPLLSPFSAIVRLQYFETAGYDARIYAYENDVAYSYSVPAFFGKGMRYYLSVDYDLTKNFSIWLRWSQTFYPGAASLGSGQDMISGNRRSELKLQARWIF